MKYLSKIVFFLCLPGIILHFPLHSAPIEALPQHSAVDYSNFSPWDLLKYETLSFDRILDFVEMIENTDNLEEIFTEQQLEEIEEFLIFLMRNGVRDWDIEAKERLEEDIAWMKGEPNNSSLAYEEDDDGVEEEFPYWMSSFNGYQGIKIVSASLISKKNPQVILCGDKFKKICKNVKRAVKRHKKEIIVAAVVVVVATVVIVATGGTGAAEAVAGGGAAIKAASDSKKDDAKEKPRDPVNKPGEVWCQDDHPQTDSLRSLNENDFAQEEIPEISVPIREIVQQKTYEIKEELFESIPEESFIPSQNEEAFWEAATDKAKATGSCIAHEVYDAVTDQLSIVSEVSEVSKAFAERLPEVIKDKTPFEKETQESYQEMVEAGHERIDEIFGTDQANHYSAESKEMRDKLTTGMLPPPGGFSKIAKNGKPLSQAYINARNGGKHAPLISRYRDTPTKEIQKSIRSHEKQIAKHKDKIVNPSKYCPGWDNFHPNRQKALVSDVWPKEIINFQEEKDILTTILDLRGSS